MVKLDECKVKRRELEDQLKECRKDNQLKEKRIIELEKELKECKDDDEEDKDMVITSDKEVAKFIMQVLDKAIPYSARIKTVGSKNMYDYDKYVINKVTNGKEEISDVIPSTLLLNRKEKDSLILKVFQEILMTNFWNGNWAIYGLWAPWSTNTLNYSTKGNWGVQKRLYPKTVIRDHSGDSIFWTGMLYKSQNQLYIDQVFNLIEKYLQKHGVDCQVIKESNKSHGRLYATKTFVSCGSLPFPNLKLKNSKASSNDVYYYLQVNFDIKLNKSGKVYPIRGYTMLLSDALTLYSISSSPQQADQPADEFGDDEDEFGG